MCYTQSSPVVYLMFCYITFFVYKPEMVIKGGMQSAYKSRTIVIDFRHRFTIISMNDTPVPIGQIRSFHSYV